jgi:pilus assembly protein CpaB
MGRRTLLLIASILIAAVGTALIALYVRGADARAQEGTQRVTVAFATKNITAGSRVDVLLTQDYFTSKTVSRDSVPDDAIGTIDIVAGEVAQVGIVKDAPLQQSMFGKSTTDPGTVGISKDRVGASFELTDPARVAGLLSPGMLVRVYYLPKDGAGAKVAVSSVKVLQIGTQTTGSSDSAVAAAQRATNPNADQVPRAILTFDLKDSDERKLLAFERDGSLSLGLLGDQTGSAS